MNAADSMTPSEVWRLRSQELLHELLAAPPPWPDGSYAGDAFDYCREGGWAGAGIRVGSWTFFGVAAPGRRWPPVFEPDEVVLDVNVHGQVRFLGFTMKGLGLPRDEKEKVT